MIDDPDLLQVGRIVHLYPQTKTASRECHLKLTVAVMKDPRAHWPMVVVTWDENGEKKWQLVHRDNIRLRSAAASPTKEEKRGGDMTGSTDGMAKWIKRRSIMPGKNKPIDMPEGAEQGTLF